MTLWLAIPLALLLLVMLLILFSSIDFHLRIHKQGKDNLMVFDVATLYGLVKLHYELPKQFFEDLMRGIRGRLEKKNTATSESDPDPKGNLEQEKLNNNWQDNIKIAVKSTRGLKKWLRNTISHVKISTLDWATDFSLGDAANTATAVGAAWGLKWTIIGFISQNVKLTRNPRVFVKPLFDEDLCFAMEFECRGRLSTAYVLYAGLVLIVNVLREKGGLLGWKKLLKEMRPKPREKSLD